MLRHLFRAILVGSCFIVWESVSPPEVLAQPANDDFPGAAIISLPYSDVLDTWEGSNQPDEPLTDCSYGFQVPIRRSVWYSYVPTNDLSIVADTFGSNFDTVLAAWTSSDVPGGGLVEVACSHDTGSSTQSRVGFLAESGRTYYFQAGGDAYFAHLSNLQFHVYTVEPIANDDRAEAVPIGGLPFSDSVSTFGATSEPGEPKSACNVPVAKTVWYSFTSAADGLVEVDTSGSDFDTVIGVWTEDQGLPKPAVCNDWFGLSVQARLAFEAQGGETYFLQVGGPGSDVTAQSGRVQLAIKTYSYPPCPGPSLFVTDPMSDTFGQEPVSHDVTGLAAGFDSSHYCMTITLDGPADPPGDDPNDPAVGVMIIDKDSNANTGLRGVLELDCGGDANLGTESFAIFGPQLGILVPVGELYFGQPPIPPDPPPGAMISSGDSLTIMFPLESVGGDDRFHYGFSVWSGSEPTDCMPNSGFLRSALGPDLMGDVDCSGFVDAVDALSILRKKVGLEVEQNEPCVDVGQAHLVVVGDTDCDGSVNAIDALKVLRHSAGLPVAQTEVCPDIGWPFDGTETRENERRASNRIESSTGAWSKIRERLATLRRE